MQNNKYEQEMFTDSNIGNFYSLVTSQFDQFEIYNSGCSFLSIPVILRNSPTLIPFQNILILSIIIRARETYICHISYSGIFSIKSQGPKTGNYIYKGLHFSFLYNCKLEYFFI